MSRFSAWCRKLPALNLRRRTDRSRVQAKGRRAKLEALENRVLLAATTIDVFVAGSTGEEVLTLQVAGQNVQSWTGIGGDYAAGVYEKYTYVAPEAVTADQVRLVFTNDGTDSSGVDRNLRIDGIAIDGQFFESESPGVASFGSWDSVNDCEFGFKQAEFLHCEDGYLQFAQGWSAGLFVVDTAEDEDDGDYSLGDRSLREALSLATGSGTHRIEFDSSLAGATIALTEQLHPQGNVEIVGLGSELLTLDAQGTATSPRRAMLIDSDVSVTISGLTITGGYADRGAAIRSDQGDLSVQEVVLRDNQATSEGGAIYHSGDTLEILESTISLNSAQYGGGVYAELDDGETLSLTDSSLLYNIAQHDSANSAAGGLYVVGQSGSGAATAGIVEIFGSTIAHNSSRSAIGSVGADHHTGGVLLEKVAQTEIVHATISSNQATHTSGGLNLLDSGSVELINSTIAYNEVAGAGSGGISVSGASAVNAANTIVAENRANRVPADVSGLFDSSSTRNLLGSGPNPGGTNNTVLTAYTSAGLAPLADNGGPTWTHALLPTSPAVDGGSDSRSFDPSDPGLKDQHRSKRFVNYVPGPTAGIVDIGAYELQPIINATGDFNGDGRLDEIFFDPTSGNLEVQANLGDRTESNSWGHLLPPQGSANWNQFFVGDFNGDGRDDFAAFNATSGEWTVAISDGNRLVFNHLQLNTPDDQWQLASVGDFDGDGSDELVGRTQLSGNWQVLHFDEQTGATLEDWGHAFGGFTDWTLFVADVDQDGHDDLVGRRPFVPGNWYTVLSQPSESATGQFSASIGLGKSLDPYFFEGNFTVADFDGNFHRSFTDDPTSVDARAPFAEVLEIISSVSNNIELELYPGLMKGPQATRETEAGNPWDQAALLVEDLLAAGHQAEIVTGKITVPVTELMDWTGTLTADAATQAVFEAIDSNLTLTTAGTESQASFRHTWVRVELPTQTGLDWLDFDPSWKFKARQPGIAVVLPGPQGTFDEFGYLADPHDQLPFEYYEDQVATYLANQGISASLAEVPYDGPILQQQFNNFPIDNRLANATNVMSEGTYSQIVANDASDHAHRVRLNIAGWNRDLVIPESALSTFTVERNASSFTFWVNGAIETTVSVPASAALTVTHALPGQSFADSTRVNTYELDNSSPGAYYSIALDANQYSPSSLNQLRDDLISAATDGVASTDIPDVLEYAGAKYWHDLNRYQSSASGILHAINTSNHVSSGVIQADKALLSGDFAFLQTPIVPQDMQIDVRNANVALVDIHYEDLTGTEDSSHPEATELIRYTVSALEHSIIEEITNNQSISTVRGFKDAYQGDPFLSGLPSNSLYVLEGVTEGIQRKVYVRGELGLRATDNGHTPYDPGRVDTEITSAQVLRDIFSGHKLLPSGANDAANNPRITDLWDSLNSTVTDSVKVIVPWGLSYVGDSQSQWKGSVYFVDGVSPGGSEGFSFIIAQVDDGAPANGGESSGAIIPANPKVSPAANFFRNFIGDPVDVLNGNMFRDELDTVMPNVGVPLDFSRHYNSQLTNNVGLGMGWTHSFSDRLLQKSGATDELIWLTSEGVRHAFTKKLSGYWHCQKT